MIVKIRLNMRKQNRCILNSSIINGGSWFLRKSTGSVRASCLSFKSFRLTKWYFDEAKYLSKVVFPTLRGPVTNTTGYCLQTLTNCQDKVLVNIQNPRKISIHTKWTKGLVNNIKLKRKTEQGSLIELAKMSFIYKIKPNTLNLRVC